MIFELKHAWYSFLKLFKFLFWYGVAVAAMFLLLPVAGSFLQDQYEALNGTARMVAVAGFFLAVASWHLVSKRKRMMNMFSEHIDLSEEEASRS